MPGYDDPSLPIAGPFIDDADAASVPPGVPDLPPCLA